MARRASVVYFEIEHDSCWTMMTRGYDIRIKTLRQEFIDRETFIASIAVAGRDLKTFISMLRRHRGIVETNVRFVQNVSYINGERERFALIDFRSVREGSISDLVYRLGGLILDQENSDGVEKWRILIPGSSKKIEGIIERTLKTMGRITRLSIDSINSIYIGWRAKDMLTPYERKALELALRTGYLDYPRKARTADIARIMGISPATFVYHFRRGEKKLVEYLLRSADLLPTLKGEGPPLEREI